MPGGSSGGRFARAACLVLHLTPDDRNTIRSLCLLIARHEWCCFHFVLDCNALRPHHTHARTRTDVRTRTPSTLSEIRIDLAAENDRRQSSYICTYACTHAHTYERTHAGTHTHTHARTYTRTHSCTHSHTHKHTHKRIKLYYSAN